MQEDMEGLEDMMSLVQDVVYRRHELIITPNASEMTIAEIQDAFTNSWPYEKPIKCFERGDVIVLRFKTISGLEDAIVAINENTALLGFTAAKSPLAWKDEVLPGVPDDTKGYAKLFPVEAVAEFMEGYNNVCTHWRHRIVPLAKRPIRRSYNKTSKRLLESILAGECRNCSERCALQCARSHQYFCSSECWLEQTQCPAPEAIGPPSIEKQTVHLVGHQSSRSIFVRLTKHHGQYLQLMNLIAYEAPKANYFKARCSKDKPVLALYKNHWHRGWVMEIVSPETVRVHLTDLGVDELFIARTLKMVEKITRIVEAPVTVIECTLHGVSASGTSYQCDQLFKRLIDNETVMVVQNGRAEDVVVKVSGEGTLNDMVNKALTVKIENDGPAFYLNDLPNAASKDLENVPMVLFERNDSELSLARGAYFKKCYGYESHFQQFIRPRNENYTPVNRGNYPELCLVQMTSTQGTSTRWLRAFGRKCCGDGFPRMHLLDYGMEVMVPISDIQRMPKELLYPAATTTFLMTGDSDLVGNSHAEYILEQIQRKIFSVIISKIEPGTNAITPNKVYCPDLYAQMRNLETTADGTF